MMREAIREANVNSLNNYQDGGPFGAVIVRDGKIIAREHNTVLLSKDSTCHAEMNAIREACRVLGTNDLSGCSIYVNAEPCPMCLSAIIWSNIHDVYFANTRVQAGAIGFRDDMIYDFIRNGRDGVLNITRVYDSDALKSFDDFASNDKKVIY